MDEFPLLRDPSRSSRATCFRSSPISWSRPASTASSSSRDSCSYPATTQDHHIRRHHARTATPGPPDPEPASGRPSARQGPHPPTLRPPPPPPPPPHPPPRPPPAPHTPPPL